MASALFFATFTVLKLVAQVALSLCGCGAVELQTLCMLLCNTRTVRKHGAKVGMGVGKRCEAGTMQCHRTASAESLATPLPFSNMLPTLV
jgi:hypothetical protein